MKKKKKFDEKIKNYLTNLETHKGHLFTKTDDTPNKENTYQYGKYIVNSLSSQAQAKVFPVLELNKDCSTELSWFDQIFNTAPDSYFECLEKVRKHEEEIKQIEEEAKKIKEKLNTVALVKFYLEDSYKTTSEHREVAVAIPETLANGVYNKNSQILEPLYDFWTNDILPDIEKYISESGYQLTAEEILS